MEFEVRWKEWCEQMCFVLYNDSITQHLMDASKDGKCTNKIPFYKNSAQVRADFKNI